MPSQAEKYLLRYAPIFRACFNSRWILI